MAKDVNNNVEWREYLDRPTDYPVAVDLMERSVAAIHEGSAAESVHLLQHPPLYTAGTSARMEDLVDPDRFPVFQTGRGGQYTYHGPGQIVGYVMMDLTFRNRDVRLFVRDLESWLIETLATFGVKGERREGRIGIWVDLGPSHGAGSREAKIAAIGVRVRRWVSYHGVSLNVAPDLAHFSGIVPCGIKEFGVTSLADLGIPVGMAEVATAMRGTYETVFGRETVTAQPE